jgi:diacylglycerol kinase (ATP)
MKHVFVINPHAGQKDASPAIIEKLHQYDGKLDYEVYLTKGRGDAQIFVKEYLEKHPDETCRFYACGGDGTLYDVINGVKETRNAEVACYASGSGNDFIKNYHAPDKFKDLDKEINGIPTRIDLLKVNGRYCVNITNYGFDGEVTDAQIKYRRRPHMSGPRAYRKAAVHCLLFKMNQYLKVSLDDKVVFDGTGLLAILANGYCYGGGFYCAPLAKINDGLIDACIVKKVGKIKAANFMKIFRKGEHLTNPKVKKLIIYQTCKKAVIESNNDVAYAIDGEVFREKKIETTILPQALSFVVPLD